MSDNYVGLDLMGSHMDVRVANFRKINLKEIPVYGMAQPASDVCITGLYILVSISSNHFKSSVNLIECII